jgi:hypothetical protein
MADPEVASDAEKLQDTFAQHRQTKAKIEELTERWEAVVLALETE